MVMGLEEGVTSLLEAHYRLHQLHHRRCHYRTLPLACSSRPAWHGPTQHVTERRRRVRPQQLLLPLLALLVVDDYWEDGPEVVDDSHF